jgi:hypothetical protein
MAAEADDHTLWSRYLTSLAAVDLHHSDKRLTRVKDEGRKEAEFYARHA